jgi:glycosyltransferase involved in cell wall biosynthesis
MNGRFYYFYSTDYEQKTGGWVYNRHLHAWLQEQRADITVRTVPVAFPEPSTQAVADVAGIFGGIEPGAVLILDHIYACMFAAVLRARPFRIVSIFHHSLAEEHNDPQRFRSIEQGAVDLSDALIVTSAETRDYVARHYRAAAKIIVAPPGIDRQPESEAHASGSWNILSVGAVIPRKRYEFAIEALAGLKAHDWSLTIVGNTERYRDYVLGLDDMLRSEGLKDRVLLAGELPEAELQALWRKTHLYIASSFYEGYGMAIAEAMTRAIPVVSTTSGAVASWAGEGATLVAPDSPQLMTDAVAAIVSDAGRYREVRERAARLGHSLATWDETFAVVGGQLPRLLHISV